MKGSVVVACHRSASAFRSFVFIVLAAVEFGAEEVEGDICEGLRFVSLESSRLRFSG